jgi:hypothetical protein
MELIKIMLGLVEKVIPFIGNWRAKLTADLKTFAFMDLSPSPGDRIIFITGHRRRISASLRISNGTQMRLGIKDVVLRMANEEIRWVREKDLMFNPGDVKDVSWVFPAERAPASGTRFQLEITDARGKVVRLLGEFPKSDL